MSQVASDAGAGAERRRFAIKFLLTAAALLLAYCFPYPENGIADEFFETFLSAYARLAALPIRWFDPSAAVSGNEIRGRFAVAIIRGCDAMEAKILFIAAVGAFPGAWRAKLPLALGGLLVLTLLNVLRITTLYVAGVYEPSWLAPLHFETWPLLMTVVAVLLFLATARALRSIGHELPS